MSKRMGRSIRPVLLMVLSLRKSLGTSSMDMYDTEETLEAQVPALRTRGREVISDRREESLNGRTNKICTQERNGQICSDILKRSNSH
jgi:hypothetical protein